MIAVTPSAASAEEVYRNEHAASFAGRIFGYPNGQVEYGQFGDLDR